MPKVRYLNVRFDQPIMPYDIPKFRAAVIEKTERVASLFHNHTDDQKVLYRYPQIQYKVHHKNACIVCLGEGVDEIHYLLQHRDLTLRIGDQSHEFEVDKIDLHYHNIQLWDTTFDYSLLHWLALNQKHHNRFVELEGDEAAQIDLLQSILIGNIIAFAKGINWHVEGRIQAEITKIKGMKLLPFKRKKMLALSVNFRCNVSLPDYVGLGKGTSVGFGVVKQFQSYKSKSEILNLNE